MFYLIKAVPHISFTESGARVLDIGCGTGSISIRLALAFPNSTITAADYSDEALDVIRSKVREQNIKNITVVKEDASKLPSDWTGKYDFVLAIHMVHDTARPDKVLRCCYEVLKPNGTYVMIDTYMHNSMAKNIQFDYAPMIYNYSIHNCMAVSLNENGMGLGPAWGIEKAEEMTRKAGFTKIELKQYSSDAMFICRKN